jgi:hypothetical protein
MSWLLRMDCKVVLLLQESLPELSTTAAAIASARRTSDMPRPATIPAVATPVVTPSGAVEDARQSVQQDRHNDVLASAKGTTCSRTESRQGPNLSTNVTPAPFHTLHSFRSSDPGTTAPDLACPLDLATPATPPNLHAAWCSHTSASNPPTSQLDIPSHQQAEGQPQQCQGGARSGKLSIIQEEAYCDKSVQRQRDKQELRSEVDCAVPSDHKEQPLPPSDRALRRADNQIASTSATTRSAFSQHLVKLAQELESREHGKEVADNTNNSREGKLGTPGIPPVAAATVETVSMRPSKHEAEFWASQQDGEFGADDDECLATPPDARPPTLFPGL